MIAAQLDWTQVALALIAAVPGIIAAIYAGRVHRQVKTPSGKPIGEVAEYTHDTSIANNLILSQSNGPTKPLGRSQAHDAAQVPPRVPDHAAPAADTP